jgi:hypothetical protein
MGATMLNSARRLIFAIGVGAIALFVTGFAAAQPNVLWTNSAGSNAITAVDKQTGALIKQFNPNKGNGRGVVVVGNIVYYTVANNGNVYKLDATTGADLGIAFTVAGASGLSNMAFDGTNFWVSDYSGTKNAFYISPTGTLIKTVSLSNCTSFCDGLEFFNNKLISNRGDTLQPANYDIYDTNGVLLQANFIQTTHAGRGIAFDGTDFYIADANTIYVYNGTTGAFIRQFTPGGTGQNYEDLSLDYQIILGGGPTGPVVVPTLTEWGLIVMAALLALSAFFVMRRRRH